MSYSSRHRYKSRREKNRTVAKNTKMILISTGLIVLILVIKNRIYLYDYIRTWFY